MIINKKLNDDTVIYESSNQLQTSRIGIGLVIVDKVQGKENFIFRILVCNQ